MRRLRILVLIALLGWLFASSAKFLVVDEPQKADAILVLAGETKRRPARALELLNQGYARQVIVDVPAHERIYQWSLVDLAEKWISSLPAGQAVSICITQGYSTKSEARDAAGCMQKSGARSVLLVTSDYHTRRALSAFRKEVPGYAYSVTAAHDPAEFGVKWWQHRQWAKTNLGEWSRLLWWELIDRWI
jgi:uncharacterized SAM-binding protein YcdF (DUF218 family)